ncbi:MAG: hypothetical protein ACEQSX_19730, partial [Baekduiaceae bacterium]
MSSVKARLLVAPAAIVLSAATLAACGGGDAVPGNAVAEIGDAAVSKTNFNHWMEAPRRPLSPAAH